MATAKEVVQLVMADVQSLAKTDRNQSQGFNFRGIDAVMNAVGPALRKHGGFIVPQLVEKTSEVQPSRNGGSLQVVRLSVAYQVFGSDGDPITGVVAAEAFDSGDKATAKAMSVAYRTFLLQLLCLPTDEPDPDAHSYELGAKAPADLDLFGVWETVLAATTVDELKAIWDTHKDFANVPFETPDGQTTLGQAIAKRKAKLTAPVEKVAKPTTKAVAK